MSVKEQLTLASGLALALSLSALSPVFQGDLWLFRTLGTILAVVLAGLLGRRLGLPRVLQPLLSVLFVAGYLVVVFAGDTLQDGLLPTGHTYDVLKALVDAGRADISKYGPPVPTSEGLVLLTAGGVGGIAVLVDTIAVVLDRAALAGLPLLLLFAVPSAVLPGGLGGLPFVLGAVGWLGLLLVEGSERVGRWGTPMRSSLPGARPGGDDSSLGRVGRRIGFAAVGLAVAIPAVIPGLDHRLVGGTGGDGPGSGSGSSQATTYNPITRLGDQLSLPKPRTLFLYRTDDPDPDYLRMTTLDQYTGTEWNQSKLVADRENARVQDAIPKPVGDGGDHRDLTVKVAIKPAALDVRWLPVPFGPKKIDVKGTWLWDPASGTAFSASQTTRNLAPYTVRASRVLPDRDKLALAQVDGIDPSIREKYGDGLTVTTTVSDLTAAITRSKISEYDKATAIQAYFTNPANKFVYDLKPSQPTTRGGDPLTAFLTGRHGFCEQYATAMAVMLRVAGIPSRVAVGFTTGSQDTKDKTLFTVTTSDAHAWPEAWFAGTGWVRFEPTPAASGASVPAYTIPAVVVPDPANPNKTITVTPSPKAGGNKTAAQKDSDLLKRLDGRAGGALPSGTDSSSHRPSFWLPLGVLAALALVLPVVLTQVRRRRRWHTPGARTAWDQLVDDATDVGHRWHPSESPRIAAQRLAQWRRLPAPALSALETLATAAEQARYAPAGRASGADLRPQVALVRAALQESSPARTRLKALLFPSSTWQWAYHGLGERMSEVLDRVDDAISTLTRPLRRRTRPS